MGISLLLASWSCISSGKNSNFVREMFTDPYIPWSLSQPLFTEASFNIRFTLTCRSVCVFSLVKAVLLILFGTVRWFVDNETGDFMESRHIQRLEQDDEGIFVCDWMWCRWFWSHHKEAVHVYVKNNLNRTFVCCGGQQHTCGSHCCRRLWFHSLLVAANEAETRAAEVGL